MTRHHIKILINFYSLILFVFFNSMICHAGGGLETQQGGDSLLWSQRRQEGFDHWRRRMVHLPVLKTPVGEAYLDHLAREFMAINSFEVLPSMPPAVRHKGYSRNVRFQFYLADTLNPSLWSQGGGYMIVHGGLISQVPGVHEFNYLMALEMAHEVLGHPVPDPQPLQIPFLSTGYNEQVWSADGFATLVLDDPLLKRKFSYSLQQESDALALVSRFFRSMKWDFKDTSLKIIPALQKMIAVPQSSSLGILHKNLGMALKIPISQEEVIATDPPAYLSAQTFTIFRNDLQRSSQQHSPWLLELATFLNIILNPAKSIEADLQRFNAQEVKTKENQNNINHQKISAWIKNRIYLNHKEWIDAQKNTKDSIAKFDKLEPFLYQRALALQMGDRADLCVKELVDPWVQFDYLRELMRVQCLLFDGQITLAQHQAAQYTQLHPEEIQGHFWYALTLLRTHFSEVKPLIAALDAKWGDRPYVRALHILQSAQQQQWQNVVAYEARTDLDIYSRQENAVLDFAKAWASFQQKKMSKGNSYLLHSREGWFPAYRMSQLYPQEIQ